jgi:hypothetical protein
LHRTTGLRVVAPIPASIIATLAVGRRRLRLRLLDAHRGWRRSGRGPRLARRCLTRRRVIPARAIAALHRATDLRIVAAVPASSGAALSLGFGLWLWRLGKLRDLNALGGLNGERVVGRRRRLDREQRCCENEGIRSHSLVCLSNVVASKTAPKHRENVSVSSCVARPCHP